MQTWLWLAVGAQFLYAISTLVDKHIVTRTQHIGKPIVYAFYVSLLSGFVIVLLPTGLVFVPSEHVLIHALLNAAAFVCAIFFLYSALQSARASDVAPVVGAVSAITAVILARFGIVGEAGISLIPIVLLTGGTAIISHFHFTKHALQSALISGVAFGAAAFFAKLVFIDTTFINGFFWTRMMNVLLALSLLFIPILRGAIFHGGAKSSSSSRGLVLGNKTLGGFAAALTAYALSLGPVSAVNALGGLQFVFLFFFSFVFARQMRIYDGEKKGSHGGWHSALGVTLIALGLAGLYLA